MRLETQKTPADTLRVMTLARREMEDLRNVVHYFESAWLCTCINMLLSKFTDRTESRKGIRENIEIVL